MRIATLVLFVLAGCSHVKVTNEEPTRASTASVAPPEELFSCRNGRGRVLSVVYETPDGRVCRVYAGGGDPVCEKDLP